MNLIDNLFDFLQVDTSDISPQGSKTKVYSPLRENVSHRPHIKQVFLNIHLELLFQLKTFFKESSAIETQRPLIYSMYTLHVLLQIFTGPRFMFTQGTSKSEISISNFNASFNAREFSVNSTSDMNICRIRISFKKWQVRKKILIT